VVTLHRPSNVDAPENLDKLLSLLNDHANGHLMIFPIHPRTRKIFDGIGKTYPKLFLTDPMDYLSFIYLVQKSKGVVTDSGGITEETTILGVPCMTLRNTTERPETVTIGTNEMVGTAEEKIVEALHKMTTGLWKKGEKPELWDGKAGERIVEIIINEIIKKQK
jgi:UDP-N-acetylglucosamine 2-epimerase (non-hydrolysing)